MSYELRDKENRLTPSEKRALIYEKEPVDRVTDLLKIFPDGGKRGWYCLVKNEKTFYTWDNDSRKWVPVGGRGAIGAYWDFKYQKTSSANIKPESPNPDAYDITEYGYIDEVPTLQDGDALWAVTGKKDEDNKVMLIGWSVPIRLSGMEGPAGNIENVPTWKTFIFKESVSQPERPTGNAVLPEGWMDVPGPTGVWWMSVGEVNTKTGQVTLWSVPTKVTGEDGLSNVYWDFKYQKNSSKDTPPDLPDKTLFELPVGWVDTPPVLSAGEFLWMITGQKDVEKKVMLAPWSSPVRLNGENGADGVVPNWKIFVFKQADAKPPLPVGVSMTPEGWADTPNSVGIWWMSVGVVEGVTHQVLSWSDPVKVTGEDGESTIYWDFKYQKNNSHTTPPDIPDLNAFELPAGWVDSPPVLGVNEYLWMTTGKKDTSQGKMLVPWNSPIRVNGENGTVPNYKTFVFKQSDTKPARPASDSVIPDGWSDGPSSVGIWWMSCGDVNGATGKVDPESWSSPVKVTGEDGDSSVYWDFKYQKNRTPATAPALPDPSAYTLPSAWLDTPPVLAKGEFLWMTTGRKDTARQIMLENWCPPIRITGENGNNPNWKSFVFKKSNTKPAAPTGILIRPNGWEDYPTGVGIWWMSVGDIDGSTNEATSWSDPVKVTGEDGSDGHSGSFWDFKYQKNTSKTTAPTIDKNVISPTGWGDIPPTLNAGEFLWMTTGKKNNDNTVLEVPWCDPIRISGEDGTDGAPGHDAYNVVLDNSSHVVGCNSTGVIKDGELGASGNAICNIQVFKGTNSAPLTAVAPGQEGNGKFSFTIATGGGIGGHATKSDNDSFYVDSFTDPLKMKVSVSVNCEGVQTITKVMILTKSFDGVKGDSVTGSDGITYFTLLSNEGIKKYLETNTFYPTSISVTAKRQIGTNNPVLFQAYWKVTYDYMDGSVRKTNGTYQNPTASASAITFNIVPAGLQYDVYMYLDAAKTVEIGHRTLNVFEIEDMGAKEKLSVLLGYGSYADLISKAQSAGGTLNGKVLIKNGYLSADVINVETLFADAIASHIVMGDWMEFKKGGKLGGFYFNEEIMVRGAVGTPLYNPTINEDSSGVIDPLSNFTLGTFKGIMMNSKGYGVYNNTGAGTGQNNVTMYYNSGSDWGIKGAKDGADLFQLGSINKIAGWEMTKTGLQSDSFDYPSVNSFNELVGGAGAKLFPNGAFVFCTTGAGILPSSSGLLQSGLITAIGDNAMVRGLEIKAQSNGYLKEVEALVLSAKNTYSSPTHTPMALLIKEGSFKLNGAEIYGIREVSTGGTVSTKGVSVMKVTGTASGNRLVLGPGDEGQRMEVINDTLGDLFINTARDEQTYNFIKGKSKKSLIFSGTSWYGEADNN